MLLPVAIVFIILFFFWAIWLIVRKQQGKDRPNDNIK